MQLRLPQPNPWPMGPSLIELSAVVHSKMFDCSKWWCCLKSTLILSSASLASRYRRPCSSSVWSAGRVPPVYAGFIVSAHRMVHQEQCYKLSAGTSSFWMWRSLPNYVYLSACGAKADHDDDRCPIGSSHCQPSLWVGWGDECERTYYLMQNKLAVCIGYLQLGVRQLTHVWHVTGFGMVARTNLVEYFWETIFFVAKGA